MIISEGRDVDKKIGLANVKDYDATGDGATDDTAATNAAIEDGSRCGSSCLSSSVKAALAYFPAGIEI